MRSPAFDCLFARLFGGLPLVLLVLLAGSTSANASPGRKIVAVFDIESSGSGLNHAALARLSEYLTGKVAASPGYQVVPRAQLRRRLRAQKKESYKGCYDQSCQIEIGKELAAQLSLSTKILRLGKECVVTMVLYDLKRSATEGAADATTGCGVGALVRAIESSAQKLTAPVGVAAGAFKPAVMGVVDKRYCPASGSRRMGKPPPEGQAIWCIDSKNRRSGPMISWHTNGQKALVTGWDANVQVGTSSAYHRNGKLRERGSYKQGKKHGIWVRYDSFGNKSEQGRYQAGMKTDVWTRFNRDGSKHEQTTYANDDKNGPYIQWYTDGKTKEIGSFKGGARSGKWTAFDRQGRKQSEGGYRSGQRHGPWTVYRNDKKWEQGSYVAGKKEGVWRRFHDHDRYTDSTYHNGNKSGLETRWEKGEKRSACHYENNRLHGRCVHWGSYRGQRYKFTEGSYKQGQRHGRWLTYRQGGDLLLEEHYREGKRDGRMVSYDADGRPQEEGEYRDNKRHGRWLRHSRNDTTSETVYEAGRPLPRR